MKHQEPVERTEYKPSAREAGDLSEKLSKFEKQKVNGRMQYPYELYLASINVISFGKFGQIQVINPQAYKKYNEIDGLRTWIAEQEMEKLFIAYPEEREAYAVKIKELYKDFKNRMGPQELSHRASAGNILESS